MKILKLKATINVQFICDELTFSELQILSPPTHSLSYTYKKVSRLDFRRKYINCLLLFRLKNKNSIRLYFLSSWFYFINKSPAVFFHRKQ